MVEAVVVLCAVVIFLAVLTEHMGGCLRLLGGLFMLMIWVILCSGLLIIKADRETSHTPPSQEREIRDTGMFVNGC